MKLGYCINMIAAGTDGTGREWLTRLTDMGLDYAEIALAQAMSLSDSEFRSSILEPLRTSGLPCLCCNNFIPGTFKLTGPQADPVAALDYVDRALDRAALLGARRVVFGSSGARNRPDGFSRADATDQLAALLSQIGDMARSRGITIVLETLNVLESNILNHLTETHALMKRVDHPAVRMLVDSYHMWMVSDPISDILAIGDDLRHVHVARTLGRGLPVPGDDEPWPALFDTLKSVEYDGGISIEALVPGNSILQRIAQSGEYLRQWVK